MLQQELGGIDGKVLGGVQMDVVRIGARARVAELVADLAVTPQTLRVVGVEVGVEGLTAGRCAVNPVGVPVALIERLKEVDEMRIRIQDAGGDCTMGSWVSLVFPNG